VAVLGVDGCTRGWVGVLVDRGSTSALFAPDIGALAALVPALSVMAIDIPIGLPVSGRRRSDVLARQALGPKASSLYVTPTRAVLGAQTYAEANARSRALAGEGLSRQAFALRAKIFDVDRWLPTTSVRVCEAHPELSFMALAETFGVARPQHSKKTWAGQREREQLLRHAGMVHERFVGAALARAGVDDILDAAVLAWTAERIGRGAARCLPEAADELSDTGRPMAIWT
jgi:predicted RNase H-like nuclease